MMPLHSISTDLLLKVMDALPDGVLLVNDQGKMLFINQRFRALWGIPEDAEPDDEGRALMQYALSKVVDPQGFVELIERLHQTDTRLEDEILLTDGKVYRRRTVSFDDLLYGRTRIWIFTDITDVKYSHMDSLTGLWNRNTFENHFPSLTQHASDELLIGIALFDIDHFKLFNDTYGHAAGDEVLRKIGEVICTHLQRSSDAGYRVGGEEFFIKTSGRNRDEMFKLIDSIRVAIEALSIPHDANPPHNRVTISCGFGIASKPVATDVIYRQVDNALYACKASGRNQISLINLDF
jgi:diguanylate cyclase (GGDEF)-like protein